MFYKLKDNLTNTEKYIVNKIEENPMAFFSQNISEFAKNIHTSTAALSRLVKKLGYKNYNYLKMDVWDYINSNRDETEKKKEDTSISSIYAKEMEQFMHLVKPLPNIITFGMSSSQYAAKELSKNVQKLGLPSQCPTSFTDLLLVLSSQKNNVLVLFSRSLDSRETDFLFKYEHPATFKMFVITSAKKIKRKKVMNYIKYKCWEEDEDSINSSIEQLKIVQHIIKKMSSKSFGESIERNKISDSNRYLKLWREKKF